MSAVETLLHAFTQRETFARMVAPSAFALYEQARAKYGADVCWQLAGVTVLTAMQDAYAAVDEALGGAPGYVTVVEGGADQVAAMRDHAALAMGYGVDFSTRPDVCAEVTRGPDGAVLDVTILPPVTTLWQPVDTAPCDGLPLVVGAPNWPGVQTRTWASEDRRDKSLKQPNPPTHWMRPALPVVATKEGA